LGGKLLENQENISQVNSNYDFNSLRESETVSTSSRELDHNREEIET
jgi:hypothetical protein